MDCTAANIRREYETDRVLWVHVVGLSASLLAALEFGRQTRANDVSTMMSVGVVLVVACGGSLCSAWLARLARRSSFDAELWRKFGLSRGLLDAVAAVPDLDEAVAARLDEALGRLRSLAAVANQSEWDAFEEPRPEAAVDSAEAALARAVRALPDPAPLDTVATTIGQATDGAIAALAAIRHGDGADLDSASWQLRRAHAMLEAGVTIQPAD